MNLSDLNKARGELDETTKSVARKRFPFRAPTKTETIGLLGALGLMSVGLLHQMQDQHTGYEAASAQASAVLEKGHPVVLEKLLSNAKYRVESKLVPPLPSADKGMVEAYEDALHFYNLGRDGQEKEKQADPDLNLSYDAESNQFGEGEKKLDTLPRPEEEKLSVLPRPEEEKLSVLPMPEEEIDNAKYYEHEKYGVFGAADSLVGYAKDKGYKRNVWNQALANAQNGKLAQKPVVLTKAMMDGANEILQSKELAQTQHQSQGMGGHGR